MGGIWRRRSASVSRKCPLRYAQGVPKNDADKKKVGDAIVVITSIEGQLENVTKRSANAVKAWTETANTSNNPAVAKTINEVLVPFLKKLTSDAKPVLKDLAALYLEGSDAKLLAKYADWKAFREKATLKLASSKALDVNASRLLLAVSTVLGGGFYPNLGNVDVKVTVDSLKNFSTYFNALRIALAKP